MAQYQEALRLKPDFADAQQQVFLWLLMGNFEHGWPEYEWRWQRKERATYKRSFAQPLWDGTPLDGHVILLHAEQGLGDTIQFVRYASQVKQRGGRVVVECPRELAPLLGRCAGIDQVVIRRQSLPAFDVHAPLLSLPGIFATRLDTIPADIPYLSVDPMLTERWRAELCIIRAFKIGIVWQGNPGHKRDRQRSVSLMQFAPLARVAQVCLFSLQKGPGTEQLQEVAERFAVTDLGSRFENFADTAAVLMQLDLVITVDTAVAHCAGALGIPVWVVLPFAPDWRWLLERNDSPWYPTMRLFRQKQPGDWDEVFGRIREEVKKLLPHSQRTEGMALQTSEVSETSQVCVPEALTVAVQHHQSGKLQQAEAIYRKILQADPNHADALHLLGVIAGQAGKRDQAIQYIRQAIRIRPSESAYRYNLAKALQGQGKLVEAVAQYQEALRLKPDYANAHNNLGNALKEQGQLAEAITRYQEALPSDPAMRKRTTTWAMP